MNNEIIKVCKTHGELKRDQVVKKGKGKLGQTLYRCKQCLKIYHRNHYIKNSQKLIKKTKDYIKNNRDEYFIKKRGYSKKYRNKNLETERERIRKIEKKYMESLDDRYIVKILAKRNKLKTKDIPEKLIELKRITMKLKRKIKQDKDSELAQTLLEKINDQNKKY